ncbi:MAG: alpha-amylase family glycosyl hydrolase, partial [Phycisphaerae bacterium]
MTTPPLDTLLRAALDRAHSLRHLPESTYRIQLHKDFTFRHAAEIVPYLAQLGVTHLYASPYLRARPGSTHGYDVIDHARLNPELGTQADFEELLAVLKSHGMSHILDTVPNHVGVATNDNTWWDDVLENGPASKFAHCFDIAWDANPRPDMKGRVLLPLLGKPYAEALESGELRLTYDDVEPCDEANCFPLAIHYYDRRFPISPRSYRFVLSIGLAALDQKLAPDHPDARAYRAILETVHALPDRTEPDAARRHDDKEALKRRLIALTRSSPPARAAIDSALAALTGAPGDARSFDALDDLLSRQCFRLAYWRVAPDEINYRRFFDINDLAGLAVEHEDVFEATHALPLKLLAQGHLTGLRIDHPDGLHDPAQYFDRLQSHYVLACAKHLVDTDPQFKSLDWDAVKPQLLNQWTTRQHHNGRSPDTQDSALRTHDLLPLYVTIEKILAPSEPLIPTWPVHGTSGYDFLNVVNALFVDPAGEESLTRTYESVLKAPGADSSGAALRAEPAPSAPACSVLTDFHTLTYEKKKLILDTALSSELHTLATRLHDLAGRERGSRDFTLRGLRDALTELIACFPVYRTYVSPAGVSDTDRAHERAAVDEAIRRNRPVEPAVFHYVARTVLQDLPETFTDDDRAAALKFAAKFQQLTAPATAKGIEDTAFYLYNRLLSLNEVGNEPTRFGMPPADVHAYLTDRAERWPYALSCLSTHDTKRSEDVRARLNVISEIPDEWRTHVERWRA